MSRGFDFVVVGVIWIIAAVIHLMGVTLFGPDAVLHGLADGATLMNGAERADFWYAILSLWVPLLAGGGIMAWAMIREYRRQANTAVRGVGP